MQNTCSKSHKFNIYCIIICLFLISTIALIFSKVNLIINPNVFNFIHICMEIGFVTVGISICILVNFEYPYNKNIKYVIPGDLFLCVSLFTLCHMFYFIGNIYNECLYAYSNFSFAILSIAIILSLIIPNKKSKVNSFLIALIPLAISIFSILFLTFIKNPSIYFVEGIGISNIELIYFIITDIVFFMALVLALIKSKLNVDNYFIALSCMLFLLSSLYSIRIVSYYDIYNLLGHVFKFLGLLLIFQVYYINNIRLPFKTIEDARNVAIKSSNIKTDYMINLSHELKTPINVLMCSLHSIEDSNINKTYYNSMYRNVLRLNRLTENIIAFNTIENGDENILLSDIDIVYLIDDILSDADDAADKKNVQIEFEHTGKTFIKSDFIKLDIIFLNLISNSLKYAPNGGYVKITINASCNIDAVIENNGPKIPDLEKDMVFEKFYKYKDKNLDSTEGLGIGLYIAKKYTEMLGGSISIIDTEEGEEYKLTIPVLESLSSNTSKVSYNIEGFFSDIN